ncbi:hypothetical protein OH77DRAFT_1432549 [Trametes cingulata]|nr:hypothetical protein OH77DRAFT_1432549 [Trametes cingulata]
MSVSLPTFVPLFVVEDPLPYPLFLQDNIAAFRLVIWPTRLLEIGLRVEMHLLPLEVLDPQGIPTDADPDLLSSARRIDVAGPLVGIRGQDGTMLELVLENCYADAAVR